MLWEAIRQAILAQYYVNGEYQSLPVWLVDESHLDSETVQY